VIEVQGNPMPGGGFVMSFTDITVFREAEKALKQSNEQLESRVLARTQELEKLNQRLVSATQRAELESHSKSRFLAAVSHDLMQPLNAARLFASSLSEIAPQNDIKIMSNKVESALESAEDLIGDLLDISRIESGKMQAHITQFKLDDVMQTLSSEFEFLANEGQIDFRCVHSNLIVESDPKLLRRILQNFLTNAFRYAPQGKVVLGARREGEQVRIEVWDNGVGIPDNKQQEIFEEFTRVEQVRAEQGLGLGLAISKGLAQLLGHTISLQSWHNQGSVFSLQVARKEAVAPVDVKPKAAEKEQDLSHLNVLCVDNEPVILEGMETLLARWGCQIALASDVVESMKLIEEGFIPDVVFSDYRLDHGRTGLEVLQQCRFRLGDSFVGVIISADRTDEMMSGIKSNGFSFMPKPVKPLKLRSVLNRA
jgi:signal transduction histidine kinase